MKEDASTLRPGDIVALSVTFSTNTPLAVAGRALTTGLLRFWQLAKQDLYGSAALPPRKQG